MHPKAQFSPNMLEALTNLLKLLPPITELIIEVMLPSQDWICFQNKEDFQNYRNLIQFVYVSQFFNFSTLMRSERVFHCHCNPDRPCSSKLCMRCESSDLQKKRCHYALCFVKPS